MLLFRWIYGNQTENELSDVPALLRDLENADIEYCEVSIEQCGDYGFTIEVDRWITFANLEEDPLVPYSFKAPNDETIVEIASLLEQDRIDEIMANYPWQEGYPPMRR
ncbi:MAG: hypothetical protein Q4C87_08295 [Actinomycetaceae bacterium]|nr:hypothetical protein [Actinomycetaceae bacterium]